MNGNTIENSEQPRTSEIHQSQESDETSSTLVGNGTRVFELTASLVAEDHSMNHTSNACANRRSGRTQNGSKFQQCQTQSGQSRSQHESLQLSPTQVIETSFDGPTTADGQSSIRNGPTTTLESSLQTPWLESFDGLLFSPSFADNALDLSTYIDSMYSGPYIDDVSDNGLMRSRLPE